MKKEDTLILEKLLTFYYSLSLYIYIYASLFTFGAFGSFGA